MIQAGRRKFQHFLVLSVTGKTGCGKKNIGILNALLNYNHMIQSLYTADSYNMYCRSKTH